MQTHCDLQKWIQGEGKGHSSSSKVPLYLRLFCEVVLIIEDGGILKIFVREGGMKIYCKKTRGDHDLTPCFLNKIKHILNVNN